MNSVYGVIGDIDDDGMPDDYEDLFGLDKLVNDAATDLDSDGLSNINEFTLGTIPNNPDTDSDGLTDDVDLDPWIPSVDEFAGSGTALFTFPEDDPDLLGVYGLGDPGTIYLSFPNFNGGVPVGPIGKITVTVSGVEHLGTDCTVITIDSAPGGTDEIDLICNNVNFSTDPIGGESASQLFYFQQGFDGNEIVDPNNPLDSFASGDWEDRSLAITRGSGGEKILYFQTDTISSSGPPNFPATIDLDIDSEQAETWDLDLIEWDSNSNSITFEKLGVNDTDVASVPFLKTGNPHTLDDLTSADLVNTPMQFTDSPADRAFLSANTDVTPADGDSLDLTFGTMDDFFDAAPIDDAGFQGFALFNYDVRSLTDNVSGIDSFDINLAGQSIGIGVDPQGLILLDEGMFESLPGATPLVAEFEINDVISPGLGTLDSGDELPIVADIFGFGFTNDGLAGSERIANQIARLELEESKHVQGVFAGSLEYTMINQLNILDPTTYEDLSTISDDAAFIVIEDLTEEDSPRVNYLETINGVPTTRSDQQEVPTHSGIVSFDLDTYKVADTVVITLQDLDLNVDSDLIDIYMTVTDSNDPAFDSVGQDGLPVQSFGPLGRLLDVTFDDVLWSTPQGTCDLSGTLDTGLAATGFTLIETDRDSGDFIGDWQIPDRWCRSDNSAPEPTTGLDIGVNYVDFRDVTGAIIPVGDSAPVQVNLCTPPISGDWMIDESCFVNSNVAAPGNIVILPNILVTINPGWTLSAPPGTFVLIQNNGGISIIDNGTLEVNK